MGLEVTTPFSLRIFVADGDPDPDSLLILLLGDLPRCKSSPWQWPCLRFAPCISSWSAAHRITAPAQCRPDWIGKLLTLHSAKGLEFPWVCVLDLQAMPMQEEPMEEEVRLLYVGMTRATHELVLSAAGSSAMVQRVKNSLEAVAHQFSSSLS